MAAGFDYDYIVVGSGFGGSVSALRLTEKGYRVAVLECGRRYRAGDFPPTNWHARKFLWAPKLGCFGILRMSFMSDVFILSGAGVGGGSLVYANTLYVPPDAFFESSAWIRGRDWKATLMPFYRRGQFMLGVTPNRFEGPGDRLLKEVATELGVADTYIKTPVAVHFGQPGVTGSDPYFHGAGPDRTGCTLCGGCMVGCRFGAKNTLDKNYLYFAEKLGCQVVPGRMVRDLRPLPGGGYEVVHSRSGAWFDKDVQSLRAAKVVLAAGVLGTVRLLFECQRRGSLPNLSPRLGDVVRTNSESIIGVVARDDKTDYSHGIAITSSIYPDKNTHIEVVRYNEGSDFMGLLATLLTDGGEGKSRPWELVKEILRKPLDFLSCFWPFGWARRGTILLVMQTLDNAIRLRMKRSMWSLFRRGLDTAAGDGPPNPTYIPIGNQVARRFAAKIKGSPRSTFMEALFNMPTTAHILGGAVMGETPETGVIGENHEVFGHPGLYVCDGSAIPANLGVNPSLTITAMTEHAMSLIEPKPGATVRHAVDPAWEAQKIAEIEAWTKATGRVNLQEK